MKIKETADLTALELAREAQIGVDAYNSHALVAKRIFYQVQQIFKLIPDAGALKATMFDKLLLAKFPTLTQSQLDHFREAVVGEVNSQVETLLAPAYDPVNDESDQRAIHLVVYANHLNNF